MWLLWSGVALATPNFKVVDANIFASCGPGGQPVVTVAVFNGGDTPSSTYVDLYVGWPWPPSFWEVAPYDEDTGELQPFHMGFYDFYLPFSTPDHVWIDVIVERDRLVLETDEGDNQAAAYLDFSGCGPG
jgi:hypothetical protein